MPEHFLTNSSTFTVDNQASDILSRLIASVPAAYDTTVGSFVYDLFSSFALELEAAYVDLDAVARQAYPQFAQDEYLDSLAEAAGLVRKDATLAQGTITFTGEDGTEVPIGTLVTTISPTSGTGQPVVFETLEDVTLATDGLGAFVADAAIRATATSSGAIGNVSANAISRLDDEISGVTGVNNAAATSGGADAEDDDTLRNRLIARLSTGRATGTAGDYEAWAMSVPGVGAAHVEPLWNGNGTVRVTVTDVTGAPVAGSVLTAVTDLIYSYTPVGADVTVITTSASLHDVSITLALATDVVTADVQTAINNAINTYFTGATPGSRLYVSALTAAVVAVTGVVDCEIVSLVSTDGGSSGTASTSGDNYVTLGSGRKAVLGTLTLSYL